MKYLLMVWMILCIPPLYAQQFVGGLVINDQTNEPVAGATIASNTTSVRTGTNGRFTIEKPSNDSLIVSYTGFQSQKIAWKGKELIVLLQSSNTTLNEVVVSASRAEKSRTEVPLAISKINAETIRDTRATALYQLLNKVSGVYMVNLGNEQHTMAIRQPITYNALYLYLEDGLPIRPTGIFNHNALYEVNMNSVTNMEVIKGPASSLYGSNSIGGAVNFNSINPPMGHKGELSVQGDGYNYYRADAQGGFTKEKFGIIASGYASSQKNSWQDYTDFDKYSGTLKGRYVFDAGTRISVLASYNYLKTQTPGSLDSTRFYSRSYGSNQRFTYREVHALRANTRIDRTWNNQNSSFLTLFFRNNSTGQLPSYFIQDIRDQAGQYVRSAGQENEQRFNSYGALFQHQAEFKFLNSKLVGGLSIDDSPSAFYADYLVINKDLARNFYTGYTNTDSLIDNYKIRLFNTAAYVQYEAEPVKSFNIVAALRYDNVRYDFRNLLPPAGTKLKQRENNQYDILAPRLGATYNFNSGAGLYTNFSIGFQPPETSGLYNSRQQDRLQEATFFNYEIGGWVPFITDKLHAEASLYLMDGRNEIISVLKPDNTTQNANAGATRHMGIEYNLLYSPARQWTLRLSGTNASHKYQDYSEVVFNRTVSYNDKELPNAPKWISNAELTWKPGRENGFRAAIEWQHIGKYFVNSANTKHYNGYDLINLRTGFQFNGAFARGAGIWLNVLNATDELYATTVVGNQWGVTYNAGAPRTYTLGISYSFNKY